ncbi:hypothetical protein Rsub_09024 [Raphidocelis subcapitata]|uniref:Uncharacterized protein n=1 Tax=Raphidocelis subcapitata TaxID=307507 RepID=A0A2V0PAR2_9CHLO|nr:hypothetical protein Rsub_09024 [Raphidocelis subcapitata]|eukprot:GBF96944.1 hypothetical protein Rsub_09024 [Raphidocelis subcapitata]
MQDLNGVACTVCCAWDQRCAKTADACPCSSSGYCPAGRCCSKTPAAFESGGTGLCSTKAINGNNTCACSELNGVAYNGPCCPTNDKPTLTPETDCPACSADGQGVCRAAALSGGGAEWCNCAGDLNGATCPSPVGPQSESKCCRNGGGVCQDQCPCASNADCNWNECCTATGLTGALRASVLQLGDGVCVKGPFGANGTQQCPNCNDFNGAGSCSGATPFCCGDGRCAANEADCDCGSHNDCPDTYACGINRKCTNKVIVDGKQIVKDCNDLDSRSMKCPSGTSYCCVDGKCASSLSACKCRGNRQCREGSCCTRQPGATARGNCSPGVWNSLKQVCPDCNNANSASCPTTKPVCCLDGKCAARDINCAAVKQCSSDWGCPNRQCCNTLTGLCSAAIIVGGKQVCADCQDAKDRGMACPSTKPICCAEPEGSRACAATAADCAGKLSGKDVAKYQAHHLLFLDAYANATFAMDDAIFLLDDFNRPKPSEFEDFRSYVEQPYDVDTCHARQDLSIGAHGGPFKGLDFATAPKPLLFAADAAAQFWWEECNALKACAADLVADRITYSHFKSWTTTAAQKILAYLQQAPGGRSLLCPPRFYWGATYQIFHRSPDPSQPFFGVHNWPMMLNPVNVFLNGTDKPVNMLNLMLRSQQIKWYIPEALLAMEGLIELLISHDHSLPLWTAPLTNATVLSAPSAPASASAAGAGAWEAAAGGSAAQGQAGEASVLLQPLAGAGLMDAGPLPAESYAAFGHVAGLQNPEALRRHPHLPSLYGCESTDAECAAESRRSLAAGDQALTSRVEAMAAPFGAAALAAATPANIAADNECLDRMRDAYRKAKKADDLCSLMAGTGGFGIGSIKDLLNLAKLGSAVNVNKFMKDVILQRSQFISDVFCKVGACGSAKDFMDTLGKVSTAISIVECVQGVAAVSVLSGGAAILPGAIAGATCLGAAAGIFGDVACDSASEVADRMDEAIGCCAGQCMTSTECQNYGASCIPRPDIPTCGGGGGDGGGDGGDGDSGPPPPLPPYTPPPYDMGPGWGNYAR